LEDPFVGAVGPVCDSVAGDQYVEFHLDGLRPVREALAGTVAKLHPYQSLETKLLLGFCMMVRREVLQKVGLFDEELVLGSDDLEFCLRLRSNGYRLLIARDVFVHHEGGSSFATVSKETVNVKLQASTAAMRRILREAFHPGPEPRSEDIWGISILPQTDEL